MGRRAGDVVTSISIILMAPLVYSVAAQLVDGRAVSWEYLAIASVAVAAMLFRLAWWAWPRAGLAWQRYKARNITEPVNLRIECPDGRVVRCGALREPGRDVDGCHAFLVVTLEDYRMRQDDVLAADAMPLDAILHISGKGT